MAAVLALLSSALWGTADFVGGLASKRLPAMAVVGWSQAIGLVALCLAVVVLRPEPGSWAWLPWSIMAGAFGAAGLVCFYRALASGTMGVVSPIASLGVVVPVLGGLATGERPSVLQAFGMVLALLGAVVASGPELSGSARAASVGLAAVSGALFGLCLLGLARGAQGGPLLTLLGMRITSACMFTAVALARRTTGGVRGADLPLLAGVGLADAGANLLFAVASTRGLVSIVSVLGTLYPVATVLLARGVLRERLLPIQSAGVVTALSGVALISLG